MSQYLNYYGRNPDLEDLERRLFGFFYLGPTLIPPVPVTCGMVDRNGSGTTYYLMWDGGDHLVLTSTPPRAFTFLNGASWNTTAQAGQDTRVYGPFEGPYLGASGVRLGVTTATIAGAHTSGPHLQFDFPDPVDAGGQAARTTTATPVVVAPSILGPQTQSYPEPTNFPAPGVPAVPGIPSSTPPPTGGGLSAFLTAYQTNTPPLVLAAYLTGIPFVDTTGWHLQHYGA